MSSTLKTVVIATSLTDTDHSATRTGAALARQTGASPWLVHAYLPYPALAFPAGGGLDASWLEAQAETLGAGLAAEVKAAGLDAIPGFTPAQARLRMGSPHREILALASEVGAGLIVVGASESGLGGLGSTAERVVRKATCPVLVVRKGTPFPPRKVLFPVDLSPISGQALQQGIDFLAQLGVPPRDSSTLFVLSPYEIGGSTAFTTDQVERFAREELERFLSAHGARESAPGENRVRVGFPRKEILAAIEGAKADLVVLGTHGRSGFERFVIGSVAEGVLRGATCNALVVPPAEGAARGEEDLG